MTGNAKRWRQLEAELHTGRDQAPHVSIRRQGRMARAKRRRARLEAPGLGMTGTAPSETQAQTPGKPSGKRGEPRK